MPAWARAGSCSTSILFQAGWFACVLGAAYGYPLLGIVAAAAVVAFHVARAARPRAELKLVALALVVGAVSGQHARRRSV